MDIINQLKNCEKFAAIDLHFANFIFRLADHADPVLALSGALVSHSTRAGDVCVELNKFAGSIDDSIGNPGEHLRYPDIRSWRKSLQESEVVGEPGDFAPLVLDERDRLYLHRYWEYENRLAKEIQFKIKQDLKHVDGAMLKRYLVHVFPKSSNSGIDWQKVAAAVAVVKKFCVISGGPGTGKTYAVARMLAVLIKQAQPDNLRIALTAPTGKAAARLAESVRAAKENLKIDAETRAFIPETSTTIHRLLKPIKDTPFFHYNADKRLPFDVILVDEASMVDLPLMSKLVQALSRDSRIILMGDRHQLASVQAGSILGDICGSKQKNGYSQDFAGRLSAMTGDSEDTLQSSISITADIHDNLIYFTHNYRFGEHTGINRLSAAVNSGHADGVLEILESNHYPEITWYSMESPQQQQAFLGEQILRHYSRLNSIVAPEEGLAALNRFRILCAVNKGALGVAGLNQLATMTLQNADQHNMAMPLPEWYHGRPILIAANDYQLNLFNGDVGLAAMANQEDGKFLQVYFTDGSLENIRSFAPDRLPRHQSVYAMTIHKSQGSEFEEILIVLPESDNPVLTRELLYTAITRAKRNVSILASESVIKSTVYRRIERTSGLRDALWG